MRNSFSVKAAAAAAFLPFAQPVLAAESYASNDEVFGSISGFMKAGGPTMYPLFGFALLALGVVLVKAIQFIRIGAGKTHFVQDALSLVRQHDGAKAVAMLDKHHAPVAKVTAAAIRGKMNPRMNDQLVREEVTRVAQAQLDGMERGLVFISLVAMVEPLIGLLGTVTGLIQAFGRIQSAGARVEPAMLAGGIWQALLTTAVGLSAAIPAAIAYTWLQRVVDVEGNRMEDAATQVFTADLFDAVQPEPAVQADQASESQKAAA
jgi:biopolymer transport protein ExbB